MEQKVPTKKAAVDRKEGTRMQDYLQTAAEEAYNKGYKEGYQAGYSAAIAHTTT